MIFKILTVWNYRDSGKKREASTEVGKPSLYSFLLYKTHRAYSGKLRFACHARRENFVELVTNHGDERQYHIEILCAKSAFKG